MSTIVVKALSGINPDDQTFLSSSMALKTAPVMSETFLEWASRESMKFKAEAKVSLVQAKASSSAVIPSGLHSVMTSLKTICDQFHKTIFAETDGA